MIVWTGGMPVTAFFSLPWFLTLAKKQISAPHFQSSSTLFLLKAAPPNFTLYTFSRVRKHSLWCCEMFIRHWRWYYYEHLEESFWILVFFFFFSPLYFCNVVRLSQWNDFPVATYIIRPISVSDEPCRLLHQHTLPSLLIVFWFWQWHVIKNHSEHTEKFFKINGMTFFCFFFSFF